MATRKIVSFLLLHLLYKYGVCGVVETHLWAYAFVISLHEQLVNFRKR